MSQRLRDLDNRVLKIDIKQAELRTEAGWRKMAARWRWMASVAGVMLILSYTAASFGVTTVGSLGLMAGVLAFQAGQLKAEDDRLNGRGFMNRQRPPGV